MIKVKLRNYLKNALLIERGVFMLIEIETLIKKELESDEEFISSDICVDGYIAKLKKYAYFTYIESCDNLIGFCSYYANDNINKIGFISMVIVAAEYRGKGVAEVLVDSALRLMKLEGMHTCKLEVRCDNFRAIKVYEKLGFKHITDSNKSLNRIYMLKNI